MIQIILPLDGYEGPEDEELLRLAFQLALMETSDTRPIDNNTRPFSSIVFETLTMRESMTVELTADYLHEILKRCNGGKRFGYFHTPPKVKVRLTKLDLFLEVI